MLRHFEHFNNLFLAFSISFVINFEFEYDLKFLFLNLSCNDWSVSLLPMLHCYKNGCYEKHSRLQSSGRLNLIPKLLCSVDSTGCASENGKRKMTVKSYICKKARQFVITSVKRSSVWNKIWSSKPKTRVPRLIFVVIQTEKSLKAPDFQTFRGCFR